MKIYIRNMVCDRCKMAVKAELAKAGLVPAQIELGEVTFQQAPLAGQLTQLQEGLKTLGFELIDDYKSRIIEQIKTTIIDLVHYRTGAQVLKLSVVLADKLNHEYTYLSNLFSSVEGQTIEKYYILQKIERVKELLVYNELTLSQIAYQTGYSSVAHLSAQFKQVTGLTTSAFKALNNHNRASLDNL
ncbi:helix-turn-helix domain-containing protein [Mucilaginibacter boryungensis]|nr:helix-turn-helix domain-containing protein [Mucilaginibacter boryungensis]